MSKIDGIVEIRILKAGHRYKVKFVTVQFDSRGLLIKSHCSCLSLALAWQVAEHVHNISNAKITYTKRCQRPLNFDAIDFFAKEINSAVLAARLSDRFARAEG